MKQEQVSLAGEIDEEGTTAIMSDYSRAQEKNGMDVFGFFEQQIKKRW